MKKLIIPCVSLIIIIGTLSSCKSKEKEKTEVCKIQRVMSGSESTLFTYDDDFRISSMTSSTYISSFNYSGNQVTILTTNSGTFSSKVIQTLNDEGLVLNLKQESNSAGTTWVNYAFEYSGNQLTEVNTTASSGTPATTQFIWTNGNMTSIVPASGSSINYTYYTDKNNQSGDLLELQYLLNWGAKLFYNKNLTKTTASGAEIVYSFDEKDRIKTITSGGTMYSLDYTCREQ